MRRLVWMLVLSLILTSAFGLTATLQRYEPYPAEPGNYVNVWVKLENTEWDTLNNVTLCVEPKYPFILDPGEEQCKNYGKITGKGIIVSQFKLRVDSGAVQGYNALTIKYQHDNTNTWSKKDLDIYVYTNDTMLYIRNVNQTPATPGSNFSVELKIDNVGDSPVRYVKVELGLPQGFFSVGKPALSYITQILNAASVKFNLMTNSSVQPGTYSIPVNITYKDDVGVWRVQQSFITITIDQEPELYITWTSPKILVGEESKITVDISNKKSGDVRFVVAETNSSIVENKREYIGTIESDDTETYSMIVLANSPGEYNIPVKLSYKDVFGRGYSEVVNIKVSVISRNKTSAIYWIIAIAVIAAIVYKVKKK